MHVTSPFLVDLSGIFFYYRLHMDYEIADDSHEKKPIVTLVWDYHGIAIIFYYYNIIYVLRSNQVSLVILSESESDNLKTSTSP